jgi:hypothetical protein
MIEQILLKLGDMHLLFSSRYFIIQGTVFRVIDMPCESIGLVCHKEISRTCKKQMLKTCVLFQGHCEILILHRNKIDHW